MVYIPSLDQFPFGLESSNNIISNTKAFYIDKYEVTNTQIENPGSNPYIRWDDSPYDDGFSYDDAVQYCNDRGIAFGGLPFTLPTEVDWEIAASAEYQDIATYGLNFSDENGSSIYLRKYYYPVSVGNGLLNCNYANIQSCYQGTLEVGSFDGNGYQIAISPSGLYDCSGNVQEWVDTSQFVNHGGGYRKILRGGSFNSEPSDAQNISFIYESIDTKHNSFGFRSIIYADEYMQILKDSYDKE
jgi:formylglycine-generating enzyme required for sulfatase activity